MAKFYQVTKEINGTEYTAQFNGISAALKAVDSCYIEGTNNTSTEKLSKYLFENVIVDPVGLTPDDFNSMEEFNDVISFAREVMQGNIKPDEKKAKEKSE